MKTKLKKRRYKNRLPPTSRFRRKELPITLFDRSGLTAHDILMATQRADVFAKVLLKNWPSIGEQYSLDFVHTVITELYSGEREIRLYSAQDSSLDPEQNLAMNLIYFVRKDIQTERNRASKQVNYEYEKDLTSFSEYAPEMLHRDPTYKAAESFDICLDAVDAAERAPNNRFFSMIFGAVIKGGIPLSKNNELHESTGLPVRLIKREKEKIRKFLESRFDIGKGDFP